MPNREEIERATAPLVGKALWGCARAVNMVMFDFGERRQSVTFKGTPREVGEYALHVSCRWRIVRKDRVVVGSRDISYPAGYSDGDEIPEEFDWDRDRSLLDGLLDLFFEGDAKAYPVRSVEVGLAGGLRIVLSDDFCLELFPDNSEPCEHWRLFIPDAHQPHFVVSGASS